MSLAGTHHIGVTRVLLLCQNISLELIHVCATRVLHCACVPIAHPMPAWCHCIPKGPCYCPQWGWWRKAQWGRSVVPEVRRDSQLEVLGTTCDIPWGTPLWSHVLCLGFHGGESAGPRAGRTLCVTPKPGQTAKDKPAGTICTAPCVQHFWGPQRATSRLGCDCHISWQHHTILSKRGTGRKQHHSLSPLQSHCLQAAPAS